MKKIKNDVPNVNSVANRDIIHRLNFLYQASVYLQGISGPQVSSDAPVENDGTFEKGRRRTVSTAELASVYVQSMKAVGKKTLVKTCVFFYTSFFLFFFFFLSFFPADLSFWGISIAEIRR